MSQPQQSGLLPYLPGLSLITSLLPNGDSKFSQSADPANSSTPVSTLSLAADQTSSATPERPTKPVRPTSIARSQRDSYPFPSPIKSVMFSDYDRYSGDFSREGSFVGSEGKRRKRSSKSKTSYSICHAPPKAGSRHKMKVRARPLLQLHRLEAQGRPKPAFELLPSAIFSHSLVKAIAKVFGTRHSLSPSDLAIVRAEEYHRHEESPADEDESRDVLALICGVGRKEGVATGRVRILLASGSEWDARQLPNGSYECSSVDSHGLKTVVRWWQKKSRSTTTDSLTDLEPTATSPETKFCFSTIAANTRRHPVIASLTSSGLEISDVYSLPAPTDSLLIPSEGQQTPESPQELLTTTEELRNIITVTACFVGLGEGWCPNLRSEDSLLRSSSVKSFASAKSTLSPPASPRKVKTGDAEPVGRSSSIRKAIRAPSMLRRQVQADRPSSTASAPVPAHDVLVADAAPVGRRARANTTSTVIVNANASQWRPDFADGPPEDDDQDMDESDEETDDEPPPALDGTAEKQASRPTTRDSRKVSDNSTTSTASGFTSEKMAPKPAAPKAAKRKSRFLSKLLCGMI